MKKTQNRTYPEAIILELTHNLRNPPRKQQELAKETIKINKTTKANSNAENIFSRHEKKKKKK